MKQSIHDHNRYDNQTTLQYYNSKVRERVNHELPTMTVLWMIMNKLSQTACKFVRLGTFYCKREIKHETSDHETKPNL